jgi:hypothetical protein
MIGYASVTGTKRNRAAIESHGWRWFLTPFSHDPPGPTRFALDNGAWSAFQNKCDFDSSAFEVAVKKHGSTADFIVLPDIVAGGLDSLEFSASWLCRLSGVAPLYLAVQDGMTSDDVRGFGVERIAGLFVGGSTEWKLDSLKWWGEFAQESNKRLHVARVNTRRRIRLSHLAGAHSFDGTSVTRFACNIHHLDAERRQSTFEF